MFIVLEFFCKLFSFGKAPLQECKIKKFLISKVRYQMLKQMIVQKKFITMKKCWNLTRKRPSFEELFEEFHLLWKSSKQIESTSTPKFEIEEISTYQVTKR